ITRAAQDELAARSHHRAAAAIAAGRFEPELVPVQTPAGSWVHVDGLVRADTSVEKLAKLRPVFAKDGTITAGSSRPLTDGAVAEKRLGRARAVGAVDAARLNVHGGSIALGHPFGATGARMVTTMANELARTGKQTAVLGICAAGGLGAAAVLERVE